MKCQICGEPIVAHKEVSHLYRFENAYKCPKCGSLYEYHDHWAHYVLLFILLVLFVVVVNYLLGFELARQMVAYIFGAYFFVFAHLYLRTKSIFTKSELVSKDTKDQNVSEKREQY